MDKGLEKAVNANAVDQAFGKRGRGRPKGAVNLEKALLHELIRPKAQKIVDGLWKLALYAKDDATKLGAYRELCDRAFGKPFQAIGVDENKNVHWKVSWATEEVPYDPSAGLETRDPLMIEGEKS